MATQPIDIVVKQEWLEPIEGRVQEAVRRAFRSAGEKGRVLADILHGTWLGHPLHPVLTDIPVGAWTAALVFDLIEEVNGKARLRPAADRLVLIGLVGAAGSAVTGIADWKEIDPPARRVGFVHGLLNVTATSLYVASLIARRNRSRSTGRWLSYLGFGVSMCAAYLGGSLVYTERIGVDHTQARMSTPPSTFTAVCADTDVREGQLKRVMAGDVPVLLARSGSRLYALAETCSHLGGPLSEGKLENGNVVCPWHSSTFSLADGDVVHGPASHPQPCFQVRVRNGQVEIRAAG